MRDPAALVMHNVIIAAYRRPNEPLTWKRWIDNGISRVPLLARICELGAAKGHDCRWQIDGGMNLMEARGILQDLTIVCRKLRYICVAQALNCDGEKQDKVENFMQSVGV